MHSYTDCRRFKMELQKETFAAAFFLLRFSKISNAGDAVGAKGFTL